MTENDRESRALTPHWANWMAPVACSLATLFYGSPWRFFGSEFERFVAPLIVYITYIRFFDFRRMFWYAESGWPHGLILVSVPAVVSYLIYDYSSARNVWGVVFAATWIIWQALIFAGLAMARVGILG